MLDFLMAGYCGRNTRSARAIEKCGFISGKPIPYEPQHNPGKPSGESTH